LSFFFGPFLPLLLLLLLKLHRQLPWTAAAAAAGP
jgi:hypothetical protein